MLASLGAAGAAFAAATWNNTTLAKSVSQAVYEPPEVCPPPPCSKAVRKVDTIAELVAWPDPNPPEDGFAAEVLGYYAKGDGGGGRLYWDAGSAEPDNGGTVFRLTGTTGPGRWKRTGSRMLYPAQFGCDAAGVTVDDNRLNALFAYAASVRKAVYVARGEVFRYRKLVFPSHFTLLGEGTFLLDDNQSGSNSEPSIRGGNAAQNQTSYPSVRVGDIYIGGITFDGNLSRQTAGAKLTGVQFWAVDGLTLQNTRFVGWAWMGLRVLGLLGAVTDPQAAPEALDYCTRVFLQNVHFELCGYAGVQLYCVKHGAVQQATGYDTPMLINGDVELRDFHITDCLSVCEHVANPGTAFTIDQGSRFCSITDCSAWGHLSCTFVEAAFDILIARNKAYSCTGNGHLSYPSSIYGVTLQSGRLFYVDNEAHQCYEGFRIGTSSTATSQVTLIGNKSFGHTNPYSSGFLLIRIAGIAFEGNLTSGSYTGVNTQAVTGMTGGNNRIHGTNVAYRLQAAGDWRLDLDTLSGGSSAQVYVYNTAPLNGSVTFHQPRLGTGNLVYKDETVSPGLLQLIDYSTDTSVPLYAVSFASAVVAAQSAVSQTFTVSGAIYGWQVEALPLADIAPLLASACVVGADSVRVTVLNPGTSSVTMPDTAVRLRIVRHLVK
ncbi:hypothetical protein D7M11_24795 [Paenibacillus ginsengarvi]|uniref:Uncharacterized protein n=1 Tax=Paenibacillus ginsengarvi TaxID=400777 RepID=A0A3B0BU95_9BACL|nr:hypothetical protein D7M11_24795 [Paenibacillus ginsengarvi]